MLGGGGMFGGTPDPRHRPEDLAGEEHERRERMSGNFRMTRWERRLLVAVVAVGIVIALALWFIV